MALKDWKEITWIKGDYYDRIWKNKKTGHVIILSQAYHNQVEVFASKNNRIKNSGWLKTKSQALKYAKAYMRKN
jgi:vancomycin permeability regulator SanA